MFYQIVTLLLCILPETYCIIIPVDLTGHRRWLSLGEVFLLFETPKSYVQTGS